MNHQEARLLIGGDPGTVPPELAEHLASCPGCASFHREMTALDANIRRALEQPPATAGGADREAISTTATEPLATDNVVAPSATAPESGDSVSAATPSAPTHDSVAPDAAAPIIAEAVGPPAAVAPVMPPLAKVIPITSARSARKTPANSWSGRAALAASFLLAAVITVAVWALRPSDTLAHDVVAHIEHEPNSWASSEPVPTATLNEILLKAGVTLDPNSDKVMYARTCPFRGHEVPHLVVSTAQGPVTVLILRYENVKSRKSFHEDGMAGVITPAPHGSIAVLAQGNANMDEVAAQVQQSVKWLPAGP